MSRYDNVQLDSVLEKKIEVMTHEAVRLKLIYSSSVYKILGIDGSVKVQTLLLRRNDR